MNIEISEDMKKAIVAGMVEKLYNDHRDDLQLLTIVRVCGLLDVDHRTLATLPIPRVTIKAGQYRYRASDVAKFINDRCGK